MRVLALSLVVLCSAVSVPAQESVVFLGFEVGEERRYALGPAEALFASEAATWSIHLRELIGDPADGVFELAHAWQRPAKNSDVAVGALVRVDSVGELRVNAHGFPVETRFETTRAYAGMGEERYSVRYQFDGERYTKLLSVNGIDVEHDVSVREGDGVDLSVPRGVFAFNPTPLDCDSIDPTNMGNYTTQGPPRPSAGAPSSPAMPPRYPNFVSAMSCSEGLFANPGLLSLVMPTLWERGTGEHTFRVLRPTGGSIGSGSSFGASSGGTSVQSVQPKTDSQAGRSPGFHGRAVTLRYVGRTAVQIGRRTRDAWEFEGLDTADALYVDDDGMVLRVDVAMRVLRQGGGPGGSETRFDERDLFIRMLYPSEY